MAENPEGVKSEPDAKEEEVAQNFLQQTLQWFVHELTSSPVNVLLIIAIIFLIYKIFKSDSDSTPDIKAEPPLPKLKKRDYTLSELRKFDGHGPDGRVLICVLGKVYDVTKGKKFYGPGGPYSGFAGRDASRGLATFNVECISEDFDDLSDLKPSEMDQVREWEMQFSERYEFVGKLVKPGEEPTFYSDASSDEEDEEEDKKNSSKKAD